MEIYYAQSCNYIFLIGNGKRFHAKILIARHLFFCLKFVLDCNSFMYKQNRLSDARLLQFFLKKTATCKWACVIIFQELQHSPTLSPLFKDAYICSKQSYKTLVKKDLMGIILFRTYEHLKLYIIFYILYILFLINSSLYTPNLGNVSSIRERIRQSQYFSLMRIFIVNV